MYRDKKTTFNQHRHQKLEKSRNLDKTRMLKKLKGSFPTNKEDQTNLASAVHRVILIKCYYPMVAPARLIPIINQI